MTASPLAILRRLPPAGGPAADGDLLRRYADTRDEAAFAEVVARNGPLVLRACRNVLRDPTAADDAFQATFVLLARYAARLAGAASVAGWLHTAAVREAGKVRRADARRRRRERAAAGPPAGSSADEVTWREVRERIDAALAGLPEAYRVPLLLCYVQGLTYAEAARRAGCSPGAFRGRLERGRQVLRRRLERLGLPAAGLALTCADPPAVAAGLRQATLTAVRAARLPAAVLSAGPVWRAVAGCVVAAGLGLAALGTPADPPPADPPRAGAAGPPAADRLDALGDPLPPGAVARMGSSRFHHGSNIHAVSVTADGKWVVSSGSHTGYRVWELETGREQPVAGMPPGSRPGPAWLGGTRPVQWDVLIAPAGDRVVAVVPDEEGEPVTRVRDVVTGAVVATVPASLAHLRTRPGISLDRVAALSPDGKWLFWTKTSFENNVARKVAFVADLTARPVAPVAIADLGRRSPWEYEFSADGKSLNLQFQDAFEVWDVATGKARLSVPVVPNGNLVGRSVLSPDGRTLAVTQAGPNPIQLWDVAAGKELPPLGDQFPKGSRPGAFSADGRSLVGTGPNGEIRIWDLATRKKTRDLRSPSNGGRPVFTPDGKRVVVAEMDDVCVLDVATGRPIHDFGGHTYVVWRVAFAPDGRRLFTGSSYTDHTVRVWDPRTGRKLGEFVGNPKGLTALALSPDGRLAATAGSDRTVRLWDAASFREVRRIDTPGLTGYGVRFTPDGREVAVVGDQPGVRVFEAATGRDVRVLAAGRPAHRLTFTPGGDRVVLSGGDRTTVRVWDWAGDKPVSEFSGGRRAVTDVAVGPGGRVVATGGWDGFARVFDPADGAELRAFDVNAPGVTEHTTNVVYAVAFGPGGRTLAAGCADGTVRVWELATGGERLRLRGHRGNVLAVGYSPDGTLLASGSGDRSVVVWDATGSAAPADAQHRPAGAADAWRRLADPDAAVGFAAVRYLAARPAEAVSLLGGRIDPVPAADPKAVTGLVEQLGSPVFADRQTATKGLAALGEGVAGPLREAAGATRDVEVRRRLGDLLARYGGVALSGDRLRAVRAVEVLERVGTREARAVLARWAGGARGAALTEDARAAAARLGAADRPERR